MRVDRYGLIGGSSSETISISSIEPGDTAIVCTDGSWGSKIIKRGQDPTGLGRWSYITIKGKDNIKLTIICGYRCCKGQKIENVGTTTAYFQQYGFLRQKGVKNSNPQGQFLKDFQSLVQKRMEESREIIFVWIPMKSGTNLTLKFSK